MKRDAKGIGAVVLAFLFLAAAQGAAAETKPAVKAENQAVSDDSVTIAEVSSQGPGWIVIHLDDNGPGAVVGFAPVKDGVNKNVVVKIDTYTATPKLYAMLHKDAGKVGTYEFPGADVPVMSGGKMVSPAFVVTDLDARVTVKDQKAAMGAVSIDEVLSNGPGWLVIHADKNGAPGPVIGFAAVSEGLVKNLAVKIDESKATPVLYAMLHTDAGKVGVYEFPGPDVPVMVDEKMVSPAFTLQH
jgi:hypothetical protein